MKKIYLFRHGETEWNINKILRYSEEIRNCGLNENGLKQVRNAAKYLKDKGIQHVYSGIFKRAYQTSEIIAEILGIEFDIVDNLHEFSLYDDTVVGLTKEEIKEKLGIENHNLCMNSKNDLMDWRPLKCETKREARNRIFKTLNEICKKTPFEIALIASHGAILREFLRQLNYEDDSKLKNCEIIETEYDGSLKIIKRTYYEN